MPLHNHYWFLRHGLTTWNHPDLVYPPDNRTSVKLSPEGVKQIEAAAESLKQAKIDLIFASPFERTKETAEIVARTLSLPINFDERLVDINLGVYHGGPKTDFYRDFSPLSKVLEQAPRGGENWNEIKARVRSFLQEVEQKHHNQNILIIGHGDPLWLLMGEMKGLAPVALVDLDFVKENYFRKGELRKIN